MNRLSRAIAVRPGEGRLVVLAAGAFAAVEAGRGLGEVGVDTLVSTRIGTDIFPALYVALGLVGLVVSLVYSVALSRSTREAFFPILLVSLAGVLAGEWLIAASGVTAVLPLVWVSVQAAGLLLLTAIWTVGGFMFDVRQAKRLFPLLTSAAIVGSLAGSLSAIVVQRLVGAEALILAEALLFVIAAALLRRLGPQTRPRRSPGEAAPSVGTSLTAGAAYVAGSPLMRLVAISYVLLAVLMFSLTYPFMTAMRAAFPVESEMLTMLALFSAAVTLASFLIGTLLANRLYTRWGVATVALVLPVVYLFGFGLWLVRFGLITAVVARFAQQVTQRGVSNAAFGAFYSVVPARRRGQVLAFMDGVPGQLGTIISGLLLIVASSLALEQVFWMGLATGLICLTVLVVARRAYAGSLVATLREARAEQVLEGGPGLTALGDARVVAELRVATRADRPQERLLAADLLGRLAARGAALDLRRLTDDEDAGVRCAALEALARVDDAAALERVVGALDDADAQVRLVALRILRDRAAGSMVGPDVAARLEADAEPRVRGAFAEALAAAGETAAGSGIADKLIGSPDPRARAAGLDALARQPESLDGPILESLADPDPGVRAAALRAAAARSMGSIEQIVGAFDDEALEVRATAAAVARNRADATPAVLAVLREGTDGAKEAALLALEGHADAARGELLSWADEEVRRASDLRARMASLADASPDSTASYLAEVLRHRQATLVARLLQALAVLGAPEAVGLIRRCLHAPDPEVRAQAIEALDALGDPGLARGVVRLLDREVQRGSTTTADVIAAAAALADDRDPWIRALALRTMSERLHSSQQDIARRVRVDPDPIVGAIVGMEDGEDAVPEPLRLVSDIDRMLVLRRVPIFAALEPEDLQRVAAGAREQSWSEDDELMLEGDVGNELIVIVQGDVRVVHRDGATEHRLRTYGPGDHIGELAVLRAAARAATVVAEPPGVRGLVIDGEAVHALLRERPDAAMAMLATLAERISQER